MNILLGITGGIAAYKCGELVRQLKALQSDVRVVMTDAAKQFVTPTTLHALSSHRVYNSLWPSGDSDPMEHISLARWADQILIAPATAHCIAKLAHGLADDLLTTLCLASQAPIALAPAMNKEMWLAKATQDNVSILQKRGVKILGPAEGEQACGETGPGRMMEPGEIAKAITANPDIRLTPFSSGYDLSKKKTLITAGPTQEALDPIRYLSNHSSGKMGFALAKAAHAAGAQVCLVTGPVTLETPEGVERVDVKTANQMLDAVMTRIQDTDIFIGCAAVADYRPTKPVDSKIKKNTDTLSLHLIKNPDILATVSASEKKPFTVGFAAETNHLLQHAQKPENQLC